VGVKSGGCGGDAILVRREFVEIIVMRDVLQGGFRLIRAKAGGVIGRGGGDSGEGGGFDRGRGHVVEAAIEEAGGDSAGGEDTGADEVPPVEVNGRTGNLAGGYFIRFFQRLK